MKRTRSTVFFAKKLAGYDLESFPYENISSFEMGRGMMGHTIIPRRAKQLNLGEANWIPDTLPMRTTAILLILLAGCATSSHQIRTARSPCALAASDISWMQKILDGWMLVTRDFLDLDPEPLPRVVLFDAACTWHLAAQEDILSETRSVDTPLIFSGDRLSVRMLPHDGMVQLPNGAEIPAVIIAVAFPYRNGKDAFFVLAMPELWRSDSQASNDPHLDIRILSVALHEMIHTRQLPELRRRINELKERHDLPAQFDDDVIESRFKNVAGYSAKFEEERDLFYKAVAETDPARKSSLVVEALSMVERRRERFFTGGDAAYAELEDLFLNMEGVAEWVRFKYHQYEPEWPSDNAGILTFLRGRENSWSQDEGLALILLLDEMVPDWKGRTLSTEMASPFGLLREAVAESSER